MKAYKKKWQDVYMSLDIKPFGKWKRAIEGSVRMAAKKEIRREVAELEPEVDTAKAPVRLPKV